MPGAWERRVYPLLAIPHQGLVTFPWAWMFANLIAGLPECAKASSSHYRIDLARNILVAEALQQPIVTDILWLDSDVMMAPADAMKLLSNEYPIVSGVYYAKKPGDPMPAVWIRVPKEDHPRGYEIGQFELPKGRFLMVDFVGSGAMKVSMDIYRQMRPPWYVYTDGAHDEEGETIKGGLSEDFYFLARCADELGLKPMLDNEVRCGHLTTVEITGDGGAKHSR